MIGYYMFILRNIIIAFLFLNCISLLSADEDLNFEEIQKSAEQGDADAQYHLGNCYWQGRGTAKDETNAVNWYRKAAEQGNASAQYNLGYCYSQGKGTAKDDTKAFNWYTKAAEQGDADAQCRLGLCYSQGKGTAKDETKAVNWYKKSAEQGVANAQSNLGYCYRQGKGTAKDETKAFEWYLKAAEQGNVDAQRYIGNCYANGRGVVHDRIKAFEWFKRAAEQNDKDASIQMACYYLGASDFESNPVKTMSYIEVAADNGSETAQRVGAFAYLTGHCILFDSCNQSYIFGVSPRNLEKSIKYAKRGADSSNGNLDKFICVSILMCGHIGKGEMKEAFRTAIEYSTIILKVIGSFVILIAVLGLTIAIMFRKSCKAQAGGETWRLSDLFLLILPTSQLTVIFIIADPLMPLHILTSWLVMTLVLYCGCVVFFVFVLKKRGASVAEAFALRKIPFKTLLLWSLAFFVFIIVIDVGYNWICHLLNAKDEAQAINSLLSSKNRSGAELAFTYTIILLAIPGIEEFIFRGIIYQSLRTRMRPWIAIAISSVIFAAMHTGFLTFIPLFMMGAIFAYSLEKTKSLYVPICLHCLNNIVASITDVL